MIEIKCPVCEKTMANNDLLYEKSYKDYDFITLYCNQAGNDNCKGRGFLICHYINNDFNINAYHFTINSFVLHGRNLSSDKNLNYTSIKDFVNKQILLKVDYMPLTISNDTHIQIQNIFNDLRSLIPFT